MRYEVTTKTIITRTYTIDAETEQDAVEQVMGNPDAYDDEDIDDKVEVLNIEDYA